MIIWKVDGHSYDVGTSLSSVDENPMATHQLFLPKWRIVIRGLYVNT
ncbi:hypothetical protein SAMN05216358_0548 [Rhizobium sp. AN5]|nr:hypothetical protein SAMN05216358_0548 [Rhizobium sp. AN5]